jgi:hypothetical protein
MPFNVGGRAAQIGDAPTVTTSGGRRVAQDENGNEVTIREPRTLDSRVANAYGTVTYTRGDRSVTYDRDGFPIFNSHFDFHLDARHIRTIFDHICAP